MKKRCINFIAFFTLLSEPALLVAAVECPEVSVVLTGMGQHIMGGTYSEHVGLEKVSGGPGYNGKWQITLFRSTTTYRHNIGAIAVPRKKVEFGHGLWMVCDTSIAGHTAEAICTDGNLELDVVNNKVGYIKTGVWIGVIAGDRMTIKFHKEDPIEPEITGVIKKVSGGELELRITKPQHEQKLVYTSATPGELLIDLKAQVTPANLNNSVQWSVPEIHGVTRIITPATATGAEVTVTYKGLPDKNSEFGFKEITASVDAGLCKATEKADVALFFPRDAKNNPGGTTPN